MKELCEGIRILAIEEFDKANIEYPLFHSLHEGYAVLQEEIDEVIESNRIAMSHKEAMWEAIKINDSKEAIIQAKHVESQLVHSAAEMVQCIAMARKIIHSEGYNEQQK